jgi:acyl-coenzyme A synthetase/AMP-(fatty) acid ligase
MIKVKRIQVPPTELEDLLLRHPRVEYYAVIGIPHDYSGERPCGFIGLKPRIEDTQEVKDEILN